MSSITASSDSKKRIFPKFPSVICFSVLIRYSNSPSFWIYCGSLVIHPCKLGEIAEMTLTLCPTLNLNSFILDSSYHTNFLASSPAVVSKDCMSIPMIHTERFIGYLSKGITISDSVILLAYLLMSFCGNAYTSWRAFLLLAFSSFLLPNEYNTFVISTKLKK